ncbi:uncharacterized protein F4807DRAFT_153068 [Annulohypoxylon truncatum]|uniref:uncharacterized protein n=1 Tax=Annulohypoxylon truncatum TaxID=327061 RepID=UPI002008C025|nr:uncharacterized protein F4807DRAFT_153068 [Annulohypoxylon truncatum]KAI1208479.1 hypothetical protein F4807DRAFT_153068 [Annulohypoxylon truncatum]
MPWKKVDLRRYERRLDNTEKLLKRVADLFTEYNREHWAVNVLARLQFGEFEEDQLIDALRIAWIQTRHHHPFIAATLRGDNHVYVVPDQREIDAWVSESFFVHKNETLQHFMRTARSAKYSSFHFFPASSEILMRTHHWQIDGMGAIHLLNRFLEIFSAAEALPTFGDEWRRLPPGHAEAAPLPTKLSDETQEAAQRMAQESPFGGKPSIGLEMTPREPGGTRCSMLVFDSVTLGTIVKSCKEAGFSVASAIHAAMIVATQEMAAKSHPTTNFTSVAFYDHRAHLQSPYNDPRAWPMGCWMLGLPFSLPHADFVTHARALQKIYKLPLALDQCAVLKYYDIYMEKLVEALGQPPPPDAPPLTQPQLSSLGVLDGKVQHSYSGKQPVSVEHIEPCLDQMTTATLVFQWSWRGRSFINVCSNENYYEGEYVEKYLARVRVNLLTGLKLKDSI